MRSQVKQATRLVRASGFRTDNNGRGLRARPARGSGLVHVFSWEVYHVTRVAPRPPPSVTSGSHVKTSKRPLNRRLMCDPQLIAA